MNNFKRKYNELIPTKFEHENFMVMSIFWDWVKWTQYFNTVIRCFSWVKMLVRWWKTYLPSIGEITKFSTMQPLYRNTHWYIKQIVCNRLEGAFYKVVIEKANQQVLKRSRYRIKIYSIRGHRENTINRATNHYLLRHPNVALLRQPLSA